MGLILVIAYQLWLLLLLRTARFESLCLNVGQLGCWTRWIVRSEMTTGPLTHFVKATYKQNQQQQW